MQRASNYGHIAATALLGFYYENNQTFDSSELTNNMEDLNEAIHYLTKATQMIESTLNYPEGSTDDMVYIESKSYTSYNVFKQLPILYFNGYGMALGNITNGKKEEVFYDDTLDVLNKMRQTAMQCLVRPALSVWKEKREIIYKAKQIICDAILKFTESVYPLEEQRIQADHNCTAPVSECAKHQEIFDNIVQLARKTVLQIESASQLIRD